MHVVRQGAVGEAVEQNRKPPIGETDCTGECGEGEIANDGETDGCGG